MLPPSLLTQPPLSDTLDSPPPSPVLSLSSHPTLPDSPCPPTPVAPLLFPSPLHPYTHPPTVPIAPPPVGYSRCSWLPPRSKRSWKNKSRDLLARLISQLFFFYGGGGRNMVGEGTRDLAVGWWEGIGKKMGREDEGGEEGTGGEGRARKRRRGEGDVKPRGREGEGGRGEGDVGGGEQGCTIMREMDITEIDRSMKLVYGFGVMTKEELSFTHPSVNVREQGMLVETADEEERQGYKSDVNTQDEHQHEEDEEEEEEVVDIYKNIYSVYTSANGLLGSLLCSITQGERLYPEVYDISQLRYHKYLCLFIDCINLSLYLHYNKRGGRPILPRHGKRRRWVGRIGERKDRRLGAGVCGEWGDEEGSLNESLSDRSEIDHEEQEEESEAGGAGYEGAYVCDSRILMDMVGKSMDGMSGLFESWIKFGFISATATRRLAGEAFCRVCDLYLSQHRYYTLQLESNRRIASLRLPNDPIVKGAWSICRYAYYLSTLTAEQIARDSFVADVRSAVDSCLINCIEQRKVPSHFMLDLYIIINNKKDISIPIGHMEQLSQIFPSHFLFIYYKVQLRTRKILSRCRGSIGRYGQAARGEIGDDDVTDEIMSMRVNDYGNGDDEINGWVEEEGKAHTDASNRIFLCKGRIDEVLLLVSDCTKLIITAM
eukprot:GHVQ01040057.1.p1 GENE.GHVQ01040057.1~~GHVQ01040057.1.p1  ORF type:complete len:658 (+),score=117.35 GHVQ01040057.1:540-2513(+)